LIDTDAKPTCFLRVAIDTPGAVAAATGEVEGLFDYRWAHPGNGIQIAVGELVLVPFGSRTLVGIVVAIGSTANTPVDRIRDVVARVSGVSPLSADWLALASFAARYYHRPVGEVMLPGLPVAMRKAASYRTVETTDHGATVTLPSIERAQAKAARIVAKGPTASRPGHGGTPLHLNALQDHALAGIVEALGADAPPPPILLYGITGSGKTEVYLRTVAKVVAAGLQALVLVPEINLTPQLAETFAARLPGARVASLHSGHAAGQRLEQWMLAHEGLADVLLGTRLAVLASLPRLGLIVVDEEHDPSYKQQEGLRYSARDLAVARGKLGRAGQAIPVVLASATPSMETWAHAQSGRYRKLVLSERAVPEASLPTIRLVPTLRAETAHGLTTTLRSAIADRIVRGEPVLVFHNRRGYAPVLTCGACGWLSACPRCSVNAVFHKADRQLHCHHCGWQRRVPRACPDCGNVDLAAVGQGTQRVEEGLRTLFPDARIARIDRDSTRRKGTAAGMLEAVHDGSLDILIGTQMLAKGHDFRNVTLVCVLDADNALYSHDFRATERLFSNLMQVAGRAGRGGARSESAEVLIQTRAPEHPLFAALIAHDFERFATSQLAERLAAGLPPYSHQAVLRAEASDAAAALAFLASARELGQRWLTEQGLTAAVDLYDPVPMTVARVAHVERAQLLVESQARGPLHALVDALLVELHAGNAKVRWHVEIDPLEI
jgi:primosomal protein N' (replication factor Y)